MKVKSVPPAIAAPVAPSVPEPACGCASGAPATSSAYAPNTVTGTPGLGWFGHVLQVKPAGNSCPKGPVIQTVSLKVPLLLSTPASLLHAHGSLIPGIPFTIS